MILSLLEARDSNALHKMAWDSMMIRMSPQSDIDTMNSNSKQEINIQESDYFDLCIACERLSIQHDPC
jgi:hypothetical protein